MMIILNIWKNVPNHQPDILLLTIINHRLTIDYPGKFHNHQPDLCFFFRTQEPENPGDLLQQLSQMSVNFHPKLGVNQKL